MWRLTLVTVSALVLTRCDHARIYEANHDFKDNRWALSDTSVFEFSIDDTTAKYNVILNIRNSIDFKTARLFLNYALMDSTTAPLRNRLLEQNLFDKKSGEPFGKSGLGNIYEHHLLLEPNITFLAKGKYHIRLTQMMRTDTLQEILSVGIRVEQAGIK